jgi:hypothetical protein
MTSEEFEAAQAIEAEKIKTAFAAVFHSEAGKRVLFWMLEQCAIYEDAFSGDMTNATNYRLGLQAAGRRLIGALDNVDPRFYPQLLVAIADLKAVDAAQAKSVAQAATNDQEDNADEA